MQILTFLIVSSAIALMLLQLKVSCLPNYDRNEVLNNNPSKTGSVNIVLDDVADFDDIIEPSGKQKRGPIYVASNSLHTRSSTGRKILKVKQKHAAEEKSKFKRVIVPDKQSENVIRDQIKLLETRVSHLLNHKPRCGSRTDTTKPCGHFRSTTTTAAPCMDYSEEGCSPKETEAPNNCCHTSAQEEFQEEFPPQAKSANLNELLNLKETDESEGCQTSTQCHTTHKCCVAATEKLEGPSELEQLQELLRKMRINTKLNNPKHGKFVSGYKGCQTFSPSCLTTHTCTSTCSTTPTCSTTEITTTCSPMETTTCTTETPTCTVEDVQICTEAEPTANKAIEISADIEITEVDNNKDLKQQKKETKQFHLRRPLMKKKKKKILKPRENFKHDFLEQVDENQPREPKGFSSKSSDVSVKPKHLHCHDGNVKHQGLKTKRKQNRQLEYSMLKNSPQKNPQQMSTLKPNSYKPLLDEHREDKGRFVTDFDQQVQRGNRMQNLEGAIHRLKNRVESLSKEHTKPCGSKSSFDSVSHNAEPSPQNPKLTDVEVQMLTLFHDQIVNILKKLKDSGRIKFSTDNLLEKDSTNFSNRRHKLKPNFRNRRAKHAKLERTLTAPNYSNFRKFILKPLYPHIENYPDEINKRHIKRRVRRSLTSHNDLNPNDLQRAYKFLLELKKIEKDVHNSFQSREISPTTPGTYLSTFSTGTKSAYNIASTTANVPALIWPIIVESTTSAPIFKATSSPVGSIQVQVNPELLQRIEAIKSSIQSAMSPLSIVKLNEPLEKQKHESTVKKEAEIPVNLALLAKFDELKQTLANVLNKLTSKQKANKARHSQNILSDNVKTDSTFDFDHTTSWEVSDNLDSQTTEGTPNKYLDLTERVETKKTALLGTRNSKLSSNLKSEVSDLKNQRNRNEADNDELDMSGGQIIRSTLDYLSDLVQPVRVNKAKKPKQTFRAASSKGHRREQTSSSRSASTEDPLWWEDMFMSGLNSKANSKQKHQDDSSDYTYDDYFDDDAPKEEEKKKRKLKQPTQTVTKKHKTSSNHEEEKEQDRWAKIIKVDVKGKKEEEYEEEDEENQRPERATNLTDLIDNTSDMLVQLRNHVNTSNKALKLETVGKILDALKDIQGALDNSEDRGSTTTVLDLNTSSQPNVLSQHKLKESGTFSTPRVFILLSTRPCLKPPTKRPLRWLDTSTSCAHFENQPNVFIHNYSNNLERANKLFKHMMLNNSVEILSHLIDYISELKHVINCSSNLCHGKTTATLKFKNSKRTLGDSYNISDIIDNDETQSVINLAGVENFVAPVPEFRHKFTSAPTMIFCTDHKVEVVNTPKHYMNADFDLLLRHVNVTTPHISTTPSTFRLSNVKLSKPVEWKANFPTTSVFRLGKASDDVIDNLSDFSDTASESLETEDTDDSSLELLDNCTKSTSCSPTTTCPSTTTTTPCLTTSTPCPSTTTPCPTTSTTCSTTCSTTPTTCSTTRQCAIIKKSDEIPNSPDILAKLTKVLTESLDSVIDSPYLSTFRNQGTPSPSNTIRSSSAPDNIPVASKRSCISGKQKAMLSIQGLIDQRLKEKANRNGDNGAKAKRLNDDVFETTADVAETTNNLNTGEEFINYRTMNDKLWSSDETWDVSSGYSLNPDAKFTLTNTGEASGKYLSGMSKVLDSLSNSDIEKRGATEQTPTETSIAKNSWQEFVTTEYHLSDGSSIKRSAKGANNADADVGDKLQRLQGALNVAYRLQDILNKMRLQRELTANNEKNRRRERSPKTGAPLIVIPETATLRTCLTTPMSDADKQRLKNYQNQLKRLYVPHINYKTNQLYDNPLMHIRKCNPKSHNVTNSCKTFAGKRKRFLFRRKKKKKRKKKSKLWKRLFGRRNADKARYKHFLNHN